MTEGVGQLPLRRWIDANGRVLGKVSLIDLAAVCLLLSLTPLAAFIHGSVFREWRMTVERVEPSEMTGEGPRTLTILGSGFDRHMGVRIGELPELPPHLVEFVNEAHVDIEVPLELEPGWQHLYVRNSRGRLVITEKVLRIVWHPEITRVVPYRVYAGEPFTLAIHGRQFERGCVVTVGGIRLHDVTYVDSTHVKVPVDPRTFAYQAAGKTLDVTVTNPTGPTQDMMANAVVVQLPPPPQVQVKPHSPGSKRSDVVAEAVQASPPPPADTQPASLSAQPTGATGSVAHGAGGPTSAPLPPRTISQRLFVVCAFPHVNRKEAKALKKGAVETGADGRVLAEIVNVFTGTEKVTKIPWRFRGVRRMRGGTVLASLALTADIDLSMATPEEPAWLYQNRPMALGGKMHVHLDGADLLGIVISQPVVLEKAKPQDTPDEQRADAQLP